MRGVLDDEAGKNIDLVKDAAGKPLVIFFLHERTRPSVALARQVLSDAANRKGDGLEAGLVLLTSDIAAMEEWVRMVPQVLPRGVPIGISLDGAAGPAAYNLSPKIQATVIIAKDNRVVANFVVQDGDPRGDGEGGPGYTIRDELNERPYLRGTVGMALAGRDTGGSQFFIAHSPQPHLDARYTVFGHVVNGLDVLDRIQQGDVIERVRIWDGKGWQ